MTAVNSLLDKYRESCSLASDSALADSLKIKRQAVHQWRKGLSWPSDDHVVAMAVSAGDPPERWLISISLDRATKAAKPFWLKALKAAASFFIVASFGLLNVQTVHAESAVSAAYNPGTLYIMSTCRKWLRRVGTFLAGLDLIFRKDAFHELQMDF